MLEQVSRIICLRVESTMDKILKGSQVRESSLVFKEQNYGNRKWQVDMPANGLATTMPFFAF